MTVLNHPPQACMGCDISKAEIVITLHGKSSIIANTSKAIRKALGGLQPDFVVCEPTGGYEFVLLAECAARIIPVHRADTAKVKAFIRSFGTLGKSDTIDATALAAYGQERWKHLPLWCMADEEHDALRDLVRRRNELVAQRTAETNRAKAPGSKAIKRSFRKMIRVLNGEIKQIEAAIETLFEKSRPLQAKRAICLAMKGIGQHTAAALVALMPELGTLNRRQAASLAGLAPHPNESGSIKNRTPTRGGRRDIPRALYMAALVTAQGNGEFSPFYKRLVDNGKRKNIALTAVMRKIVVTLNARIRDERVQFHT